MVCFYPHRHYHVNARLGQAQPVITKPETPPAYVWLTVNGYLIPDPKSVWMSPTLNLMFFFFYFLPYQLLFCPQCSSFILIVMLWFNMHSRSKDKVSRVQINSNWHCRNICTDSQCFCEYSWEQPSPPHPQLLPTDAVLLYPTFPFSLLHEKLKLLNPSHCVSLGTVLTSAASHAHQAFFILPLFN